MKKYEKPIFEMARFDVCDSVLTLSMAGTGDSNNVDGDLVIPTPDNGTAASLLGINE